MAKKKGLNEMNRKNALACTWLATAMLVTAAKGGFPELPLNLGSAGDFVILAKSGISTVPYSDITGDMGVSPITATAITGFSLILDLPSLGQFSTSAQVTGKIYAADYADPTPVKMTAAISAMETAYTEAAGRTLPNTINLGAIAGGDRDIGGLTIAPGLHTWSTGVLISTDVWLDAAGNPDAVFIFQISGDLTLASYKKVILSGGAQAKNIFWQVAGGAGAIIGTYAHFEGVVLSQTGINVLTGASFNGKLLAQTDVNLDQNNIMDSSLILAATVRLEIVSAHGVGTPPTGVYFNVSGSLLTNRITAAEANGGTQYVNTGWSMIGNGPEAGLANSMNMVHTNDAVLTWLWSTNYLLNASAGPGGGVTGSTNGFYVAGSTTVVTATPSLGYHFAGWTGNVSGPTNAAAQTLFMDQARTVVAHFAIDRLTLTIISAHGVGTPLAGLPAVGLIYANSYGAPLTNRISAVEANGGTQYVATGWSMSGHGPISGTTNSMSMVLTNNAVLTWLWNTNYLLNASAGPGGGVTGSANGFYVAGATTVVTATPSLGYQFAGWTGNVPGPTNAAVQTLLMSQARTVAAHFSPIFVDVSAEVNWNVNWMFNPRLGYFVGTLTITNRVDARKSLLAPVWFEVESTEWHWLRFPTGVDTNTGMHYLDISAAVASQLPGIGDGDLSLDPGESVTVTGIELMGRRTPTGLVMAVWADPPNALTIPVDTDGDGMPDVSENIAGTSATDPNSVFQIRLGPDGRSVQWDSQPNRIYKVLASTNLLQGFVTVTDNIEGSGTTKTCTAVPQVLGSGGTQGTVFFRVEVKVK